MPAYWTIKGEAGKAMDATVRDLNAVGAIASKVAFRALDVDVFTYSVPWPGSRSDTPHFPALRSDPLAHSGATRRKQNPGSHSGLESYARAE